MRTRKSGPNNSKSRWRRAWEWYLRVEGADPDLIIQDEDLTAEVLREVQIIRRIAWRNRVWFYPGISLAFVLMMFSMFYLLPIERNDSQWSTLLVLVPMGVLSALAALTVSRIRLKSQETSISRILTQNREQAMLGLLSCELHLFDKQAFKLFNDGLAEFMAVQDERTVLRLSPKLQQWLSHWHNDLSSVSLTPDREHVLLTWLGLVYPLANARTLQTVKRYARLRGKKYGRIRQAALELAPRIEARLAVKATEEALLRPAEQPQTDTLLRPAGAGVGEEERLLRAVVDGTESAQGDQPQVNQPLQGFESAGIQ